MESRAVEPTIRTLIFGAQSRGERRERQMKNRAAPRTQNLLISNSGWDMLSGVGSTSLDVENHSFARNDACRSKHRLEFGRALPFRARCQGKPGIQVFSRNALVANFDPVTHKRAQCAAGDDPHRFSILLLPWREQEAGWRSDVRSEAGPTDRCRKLFPCDFRKLSSVSEWPCFCFFQ